LLTWESCLILVRLASQSRMVEQAHWEL